MATFDFSGFTTCDLLRLAQMAMQLVNNRFVNSKIDIRDSDVYSDSSALAVFCVNYTSIFKELLDYHNDVFKD